MARSHFYRPLQDNHGDLVTDASVRVLQPGTTTLITDTMWDSVTGGTALPNPFSPTTGIVDFYMDTAQTVKLGITSGVQPEVFIDNIDVGDPEDFKESF